VAKAFDTGWIEGLLCKLTALKFPSYLVETISSYLQYRTLQATFQSATSTCRGMRDGVAQGGIVSPVLFSLYVNDMPTPSHHVELPLCADDMDPVATSRRSSLLINYLQAYLCRLQHWLRDWRISINVSKSTEMLFTTRSIQRPRPIQLPGELIVWVEMARHLELTLNTRLTWLAHINQVRRKTTQILGVLRPLLNRRSGLSIRNGVLLYKQLIRPMMDYECPVWSYAAGSHVRKLQVLQSKCLRIATNAPWHDSNKQIHDDLGIPFYADHIRTLTESFESILTDAGNPLVRQL
jgi:hypothetical protein